MNHTVPEPEMEPIELRTWVCSECESYSIELDEDQDWPECPCLGTMYVVSRRTIRRCEQCLAEESLCRCGEEREAAA